MQKSSLQAKYFFLFALFLLFLSGCNIPQTPEPEPTISAEEISFQETEAAALIPTETPEPELRKAILIAPSDTTPYLLNTIRDGFAVDSNQNLEFIEAETLSESMLDAKTETVVFSNSPADIGDYAQKHPEIQFVVIGGDPQPFGNVLTIRYDPGFETFLGGYALALSATDWRGAGLIPSDVTFREETFLNGAQYFCGRCQSVIAPYVVFPLVVSLPSSASAEEWSSGIDQILSNYIYSFYISPEAASDALFEKFSGMEVTLLGANDMPASLESKWLATIRIDIAGAVKEIVSAEERSVRGGEIIPELLIVPGGVGKTFHEGRKIRIEEVYQNLLSGLISAYDPVPPATFEK